MRKLVLCCGILLVLVARSSWAASAPAVSYPAQIAAVAADGSWLQALRTLPEGHPDQWETVRFTVTDPSLKDAVKNLQPQDLVRITAEGSALKNVVVRKAAPSTLGRLATLALAALTLWIITWLLLGRGRLLRRFLVGMDNRYSKSKFQVAIWFAAVVVTYLGAVYLRWWASVPSLVGGVDIPQNLLLLSGISALSFAGAKGITQGKQNNLDRATGGDLPVKPPAPAPRFPADLVTDDNGQPDLGDFQMVVITLIAVCLYGVSVFSWLGLLELKALVSLPDVDTTMLGIFGISHGTYLVKKAVGDDGSPGPRQESLAVQRGSGAPGPV